MLRCPATDFTLETDGKCVRKTNEHSNQTPKFHLLDLELLNTIQTNSIKGQWGDKDLPCQHCACADAADALMLLMRWCCWYTDAADVADALMLLITRITKITRLTRITRFTRINRFIRFWTAKKGRVYYRSTRNFLLPSIILSEHARNRLWRVGLFQNRVG